MHLLSADRHCSDPGLPAYCLRALWHGHILTGLGARTLNRCSGTHGDLLSLPQVESTSRATSAGSARRQGVTDRRRPADTPVQILPTPHPVLVSGSVSNGWTRAGVGGGLLTRVGGTPTEMMEAVAAAPLPARTSPLGPGGGRSPCASSTGGAAPPPASLQSWCWAEAGRTLALVVLVASSVMVADLVLEALALWRTL